MANYQVKDANGTTIYMSSSGTGAIGDPFVPVATLSGTLGGDVANDAVDSGNPVKIGGKALSANPTAVASGDRVNALFDLQGRLVVANTIPEALVRGVSSAITGTSDTAVIAAQGSGIRIYVTHIQIFNSHATVATQVNIKDGATTIYSAYVTAAGGQTSITLPSPLRLTANTALNAANVTTGSNVIVSASGFIGA